MTPVTSRASASHLRQGDDENDVKASPSFCFSNSHYTPTLGGALGHEMRTTTEGLLFPGSFQMREECGPPGNHKIGLAAMGREPASCWELRWGSLQEVFQIELEQSSQAEGAVTPQHRCAGQ